VVQAVVDPPVAGQGQATVAGERPPNEATPLAETVARTAPSATSGPHRRGTHGASPETPQ